MYYLSPIIPKVLDKIKGNPMKTKLIRESLKHFSLIKKNIYLDRKMKTVSSDDHFLCSCIRLEDGA